MIGFLSILAVGFFLGMRHATDPDQVIAVTTLVSNQRNSMRAAMAVAFWGIGHPISIFLVGVAVILFNLVIPVRARAQHGVLRRSEADAESAEDSWFLRSIPAGSVRTHDGEEVTHAQSRTNST